MHASLRRTSVYRSAAMIQFAELNQLVGACCAFLLWMHLAARHYVSSHLALMAWEATSGGVVAWWAKWCHWCAEQATHACEEAAFGANHLGPLQLPLCAEPCRVQLQLSSTEHGNKPQDPRWSKRTVLRQSVTRRPPLPARPAVSFEGWPAGTRH